MDQVRVGHGTNSVGGTGVTVILFDEPACGACDVRGAAPGSRETDLLRPGHLVQTIDALVLAGGSAFGLEAATGVVSYLEENGRGFPTRAGPVPIVPAAVIYDLEIGDPKARPDATMGYDAAVAAKSSERRQGSVGAGTGATVGKLLGMESACRGGLGQVEREVFGAGSVLVVAVVNALGDILDPAQGELCVGARDPSTGEMLGSLTSLEQNAGGMRGLTNTTLVAVVTDIALEREELNRLAQMAHDGLARVIDPVHTMYDGDVVFAVSTRKRKADLDLSVLGAKVAHLTSEAIVSGVKAAQGFQNCPSWSDLKGRTE